MSGPEDIPVIVREVTEIENSRVLTIMGAIYVKSRFPDLTVIEIFEKMEDPAFIRQIIIEVMKEEHENTS